MTQAARRPARPLFSILDLWARPISFLPILGRIPGSDAVAALWMSHALERQRQAGEGNHWICPGAEWYDATLLGRKEQERARRIWSDLGIVMNRRVGGVVSRGNALSFMVNVRALDDLVRAHLDTTPPAIPKRPKRTLPKRPKGTVPEMSQTDTSTIIPVALLTEEPGKNESEKGVWGKNETPESRTDDQQQAAATAARALHFGQGGETCSKPTAEEWAEHCRTTWETWSAEDISRAYLSAVAAGWRKSRGGVIRDWRAYAAVCANVWANCREGKEAAKRAREAAREQAARADSLRRIQQAREAGEANALTPEQRAANQRALMSGLFGQRAAA